MKKSWNDSWKKFYTSILAENRIIVFGHRGVSSEAPENTIAAFKKLLEQKITGVELDVMLCATGEIVVSHDSNLKKVTGLDIEIGSTSLKELKEYDVGSWFSKEFNGEKIPLLEEVFELLGKNVIYNIETKTETTKTGLLEEKLLEMIDRYGLQDRCIISSFNPLSLKSINRLNPQAPISLIYSRSKRLPFYLRHGEGRLFTKNLFIQPYYKLLNSFTSFIHREIFGNPIITWTIDDPQNALKMAGLGVIGVISNKPLKIMGALKNSTLVS